MSEENKQPTLGSQLSDVVDQLTRYGGEVHSQQIINVLWRVEAINEGFHNMASSASIKEDIELAKAALDKLLTDVYHEEESEDES